MSVPPSIACVFNSFIDSCSWYEGLFVPKYNNTAIKSIMQEKYAQRDFMVVSAQTFGDSPDLKKDELLSVCEVTSCLDLR